MKTNRKLAVSAGALALLLTTTAFADARDNGRDRHNRDNRTATAQRSTANGGTYNRSDSSRSRAVRGTTAPSTATTYNRSDSSRSTAGPSTYNRNDSNRGTYNRNDSNRSSASRGTYNNGSYNRGNSGTYNRGNTGSYNRGNGSARVYRDNDRVTYSGRVSSFSRERDGYRVHFDGVRESYWIPASRFGRGHDLRIGASLRLGGIFRGGIVNVDVLDWNNYGYDPYYGGGYTSAGYGGIGGVVERVDYRTGYLLLRDSREGRSFEVDMRDTLRASRVDFGDLRPGDYVELSGSWLRNGTFAAARIDSVDTGRY
jgi:hypothetical protein